MPRFENPLISCHDYIQPPTVSHASSLHSHVTSAQVSLIVKMERECRTAGCELIRHAGLLLRLSQNAIASACVLYQRFYYRVSMTRLGPEDVAMGALFLATKLAETPRRVREIVNVFHALCTARLKQSYQGLDYIGGEYYDWRDRVTFSEAVLLRELGFQSLDMRTPYALLIHYCQLYGLLAKDEICRKGLGYLNDSYHTQVHVIFQPNVIACACLALADQKPTPNMDTTDTDADADTDTAVSDTDDKSLAVVATTMTNTCLPMKLAWYHVFSVSYDELRAASMMILSYYHAKKNHAPELPWTAEAWQHFLEQNLK